jgi:diguanylate cyclase (GGDEF)-like protein/PAS domain S-box-containing protein
LAQGAGDERDRLRRLRSLLHHRVLHAFAITSGGGSVPVDLTGLDLGPIEVIDAVAALEQVAAEDQALAIAGVARALETGSTADELRMADGSWATTHLFDLSASHGALVGLVLASHRLATVHQPERPEVSPRVGHATMDRQGRVLWENDNIRRMFGYGLAGDPDRHIVNLIHEEDRARNLATWAAALATPDEAHRVRYRQRHEEGRWIWCEATFVNRLRDQDDPRVDCEVLDITSEMEAHEAIRARERLLQRLAESLPDGVLQLDHRRQVVYANSRAVQLLGADATLAGLVGLTVAADRPVLTDAIDTALTTGADRDAEVRVARADGDEPAVYRVTLRAVTDEGDGDGSHPVAVALCCIADVTEEIRHRRALEVRATVDDLTGAANRVATMKTLDAALADARPGAGVAVVFVDLDDFKQVNDNHGHPFGDLLLRAVARRLLDATRAGDVVGRYGGDEFLVVFPAVNDPAFADELVGRVRRALAEPELLGEIAVVPAASLGVASTFEPCTAERLIARADAHMYAAKRARG